MPWHGVPTAGLRWRVCVYESGRRMCPPTSDRSIRRMEKMRRRSTERCHMVTTCLSCYSCVFLHARTTTCVTKYIGTIGLHCIKMPQPATGEAADLWRHQSTLGWRPVCPVTVAKRATALISLMRTLLLHTSHRCRRIALVGPGPPSTS